MLAVDSRPQELWTGEDVQGTSLVSSASGQSRSDLESFAPETIARKITSTASSVSNGNNGVFKIPGVLRIGEAASMGYGQATLPAEKAFSLQIGWRLFRLSGASIMSDAPSYFSIYFEEQLRQQESGGTRLKTLFIDRDPDTFADICRHLQGYWIHPRDNAHYVKLYADAHFYSLQRLISQLFDSEIYVSVGGEQFQIPRATFSGPGNSPNFFSLGFAGFLGSRDDAFPGLETKALIRPPPVQPQKVPNRSPAIFADLIQLLRGYPLSIRDHDHRAALIGDSKYYGFRGLMHNLFSHDISYNAGRGTSEIIMRLEDLHKSGISFIGDASPSDQSPLGGWVYYSRPFVDEISYEVIVEIANQETKIDFRSMRADFHGETKARISSLFQTIADKMNLPSNIPLGLMLSSGGASAAPASPANSPLSEDRVKIRIGPDAHIILDGQEHTFEDSALEEQADYDPTPSTPVNTAPSSSSTAYTVPTTGPSSTRLSQPPAFKKRKRRGSLDDFGEWVIRKGQWRMRVQPKVDYAPKNSRWGTDTGGMEIVLCAVKLDAVSGQRGRSLGRGFVS